MRNFVQPGNVLTVPAPTGGVTSGDPILVGSMFGVAATTQAEGNDVEISVTGVFDLPKASVAPSLGSVAYFDSGAGKVTNTSASGANKRIGLFVLAAQSGDATGRVRLDGSAS